MKKGEILNILRDIRYRDWVLRIEPPFRYDHAGEMVSFRWEVLTQNARNLNETITLVSSSQRIPPSYTERDILQLVRASIQELMMHEIDEFFRYRGVMIFDPHIGDPGYKPERVRVLKPFKATARFEDRPAVDGEYLEEETDMYTRFR